jgi:hypothetical protein
LYEGARYAQIFTLVENKGNFATTGVWPPLPLLPPVALQRLFKRNTPGHHITGKAVCARFVENQAGGYR